MTTGSCVSNFSLTRDTTELFGNARVVWIAVQWAPSLPNDFDTKLAANCWIAEEFDVPVLQSNPRTMARLRPHEAREPTTERSRVKSGGRTLGYFFL